MKGEELLAEEYYYKTYPVTLNIGEEERKKEVTDIFLAGLKAGRPQWHDPEELPPKEKNTPNTSIYVLDQYGQKVFYSFFYKVWKNKSDFETKVTHWCEIPTFDKESK